MDEAPWLWIVHDGNPRAMTKKVKGFANAQSWFQDFTLIEMSEGSERGVRPMLAER